jgi:hypothetical protein
MLAGCGAGDESPVEEASQDISSAPRFAMMPTRGSEQSALPAPVAPGGARLIYRGGKIIQKPTPIKVLYGTGTYLTQISGVARNGIVTFYDQVVSSGAYDWLSEYSTFTPRQAVGRGAAGGAFQIAPTAAHNLATITDASIRAELATNITNGTLPAATDDFIYMVSFPAGKAILAPNGSHSCTDFCGYHSTFQIGARNIYYAVLPDMTGACATVCGSAPTVYQNQTSVASNVLVETILDPELGLATQIGPPLAWYDAQYGESGNICGLQEGTFVGSNGSTYTIHNQFSNAANDCISTRTDPVVPALSNGVALTNVSAAPGVARYYKITVPANQPSVVFTTSAGTGDVDISANWLIKPQVGGGGDCFHATVNSNNETCTINNPAAGDYYVMLYGLAQGFSGVTLVAHYP